MIGARAFLVWRRLATLGETFFAGVREGHTVQKLDFGILYCNFRRFGVSLILQRLAITVQKCDLDDLYCNFAFLDSKSAYSKRFF